MTTNLITVSPETTVAEAARQMLIHHVTAIPAVDPDNRPLGLISEGDVIRQRTLDQASFLPRKIGLS
ncbi:CBS domain-containing protein [Rhizobium leguminosarum]|uniref:CBS domain-containing protein n=1 Tax=Rhizobium leguminosarum TaxID=384 RepID=UPI001FD960DD|nr:CBS domain-containing protein [Rhizobium leguminosarum]